MTETLGRFTPSPAVTIAKWLDHTDELGSRIPTQKLTDDPLPHPLGYRGANLESHQLNLQLGVIVTNLLDPARGFFTPAKADELTHALTHAKYLDLQDAMSPMVAVNKLIAKQKEYLPLGQSWQFGKVGLEINPGAQQIAYKLHALQELIEPFASDAAKQYEDQIADILTREILDNGSQFKFLSNAIGPYRFSVRWCDFLPGGENPKQFTWIEEVLKKAFPPERTNYDDILLSIAAMESKATPGTIMQLLERKTFRSQVLKENGQPKLDAEGNVQPLKPGQVADSHRHANKIEFYLPLMGAGGLKVKFAGENHARTFNPDPNVAARLDLSKIGAVMEGDTPTLVYDGKKYRPEGHFINLKLPDETVAQFIVVMPGDIHDYQNVGISPASAYALTLGFPKDPSIPLAGDFESVAFS